MWLTTLLTCANTVVKGHHKSLLGSLKRLGRTHGMILTRGLLSDLFEKSLHIPPGIGCHAPNTVPVMRRMMSPSRYLLWTWYKSWNTKAEDQEHCWFCGNMHLFSVSFWSLSTVLPSNHLVGVVSDMNQKVIRNRLCTNVQDLLLLCCCLGFYDRQKDSMLYVHCWVGTLWYQTSFDEE